MPAVIKKARLLRGLTMEELASRVGVNVATIYNVETGKHCASKTVWKICAELGISTSEVWK